MELKTYRANSLHEALQIVRHELGPDAAVLHTREVRRGWLGGRRQVEVTASTDVHVPSRFQRPAPAPDDAEPHAEPARDTPIPGADTVDFRSQFREDLKDQISELQSLVEDLCQQSTAGRQRQLPDTLFDLFTELIDVSIPEAMARELIERVRSTASQQELEDAILMRARLTRSIEEALECTGPIQISPGHRKLVALVGPTGVGKTTTIAKLAANFHLRERCRVGLITVDTYRIAAVDQLRTYAEIIDLPMAVVTTPREMRLAVASMSELDLILVDTAGRSPRDEVRIQELKSLLAEAQADEVHLVLSSVASLASMRMAVEQFGDTGIRSVILTKLDEAHGIGCLLPWMRHCRLPVSYVTFGQNVPDDIAAADRRRLGRAVLGRQFVAPLS